MMASINFLQRKTKNSPAFKLIQAHIHQRQSHLTNNIYNHLKEQTQKRRNQNAQDKQFENRLEKKIAQDPSSIALTKTFSRSKHKQQQERKRKLFKFQSLSPKRSYQLETQASVGRKERMMKSMLAQDSQYGSRQLSRTHTINPRPQTANPLRSTQLSHEKKNSLRSSTRNIQSPSKNNTIKKLSRSLSTISGQRYTSPQQNQPQLTEIDYFNQVICQIRKSSKKFQQSMVLSQQQLQRVMKVYHKMQNHFGNLLLEAKQFSDIEFDNYNRMTRVDRYKFSSNYILENLMSKNDQEVQEWIEREKHKQLRKKGSMAVHFSKHIISQRDIKRLDTNQKNQLYIQNDNKIRKFLQNPEDQINRIRRERNIVRENNLVSNNRMKNQKSPLKGQRNEDDKPHMSMTEYGKNFKEIKQYQKRKFMSKTAYQPKRNKNFALIVQ